jgi:hypothetical protein
MNEYIDLKVAGKFSISEIALLFVVNKWVGGLPISQRSISELNWILRKENG